MKNISEKEFDACMKEIQEKNASIERRRKLKKEKNKYKYKFKLPSTSKIVLLVVFLMCIEILIFAQYASIVLNDASALITLIGVPVTLIPIVWKYMDKSKAENTQGGITYEKVIHELSQQNSDYIESDNAVG